MLLRLFEQDVVLHVARMQADTKTMKDLLLRDSQEEKWDPDKLFGFAYAAPNLLSSCCSYSILATARPYLAALKARRQHADFRKTSTKNAKQIISKRFQNKTPF